MNKHAFLTAARLSAAGLLTVMVAACGSDKKEASAVPPASSTPMASSAPASSEAPVSSSSVADSSSSVAVSSSSAVVSSSSVAVSSSSAPSSISSSSSSSAPAEPDAVTEFSLDFEGMTSFPDGFNPVGNGIDVVTEGAAFGSGALEVEAIGKEKSYLSLADVSGTHWGRLYYRNTVKPAITQFTHTTLLWGVDGSAEFRFVDMVAAPDDSANADLRGKYQHLYNTEPNDLSLEGPYNNVYDGQWVCFEWSMDAAEQEIKFFIDGSDTPIETANNASMSGPTNATDLETAKSFNPSFPDVYAMTPVPDVIPELRIGIQNFQDGGFTFLMDNVAIGQARLGCETIENPVASSSSSMSSSSEMSSSSAMSSSSEMSSSSMMSSSSVMSSSAMSSSSAPSGPTQEEIDARVAAGKVLYDGAGGNGCVSCHGATGMSPFNITMSTKSYDDLATSIRNGLPNAAVAMPACKPAGDCAEQMTDYIWVQFLGLTLTEDGGER